MCEQRTERWIGNSATEFRAGGLAVWCSRKFEWRTHQPAPVVGVTVKLCCVARYPSFRDPKCEERWIGNYATEFTSELQ